jgi:hypothetical protein
MAKKKPKRRQDVAQNAHRIMLEATGQAPKTPDPDAGKNPKAIVKGRRGGTKGGPARAAKLSPIERARIARKAAMARWKNANQD